MKLIAVYVDQNGQVASLSQEGSIKVYSKVDQDWMVQREITFEKPEQIGIAQFRKSVLAMVEELNGCTVFVASEMTGQLYYVLETHGFNLYEAEGRPEEVLDSICTAEQVEDQRLEASKAEAIKTPLAKMGIPYPEKIEQEGGFRMNLKEIMCANPSLTSKRLLLSFVRTKKFNYLEIICEHVPQWFEEEFNTLGYHTTIDKLGEHEYKVAVSV